MCKCVRAARAQNRCLKLNRRIVSGNDGVVNDKTLNGVAVVVFLIQRRRRVLFGINADVATLASIIKCIHKFPFFPRPNQSLAAMRQCAGMWCVPMPVCTYLTAITLTFVENKKKITIELKFVYKLRCVCVCVYLDVYTLFHFFYYLCVVGYMIDDEHALYSGLDN